MSFLIRVIRANPWRKSALEPGGGEPDQLLRGLAPVAGIADPGGALDQAEVGHGVGQRAGQEVQAPVQLLLAQLGDAGRDRPREIARSEEHTSELQSLMRISYAVFCLKKKNKPIQQHIK